MCLSTLCLLLAAMLFHSLTVLINSSRLVLKMCAGVCLCVRSQHSPARGQGVTVEPRGHCDNSLPSPRSTQTPLASSSSPGWQSRIRQKHTHTHTHSGSANSPCIRVQTHTRLLHHHYPLLLADRYNSSPFI